MNVGFQEATYFDFLARRSAAEAFCEGRLWTFTGPLRLPPGNPRKTVCKCYKCLPYGCKFITLTCCFNEMYNIQDSSYHCFMLCFDGTRCTGQANTNYVHSPVVVTGVSPLRTMALILASRIFLPHASAFIAPADNVPCNVRSKSEVGRSD